MNSMRNEIGGRKMSKGRKVSPALNESCSNRSLGGGGALKKGPWTSAEDAILLDYVTKHGEGNWNAVQKNSGLSRCGKSCRLRWANHLRPDLKKGAFTPEEERRVIELHATMGNKWSRMAAQLPGRTDNEIKNYWNTRIKRLQRSGLSAYPPDVYPQVMNGNLEGPNMGTNNSYMLEGDRFVIPEVEFKNLDQEIYSYTEPLLDLPISKILTETATPSPNFSFMFPKSPRDSETLFPCEDGAYPFGPSSSFDPDFNYNHQFPLVGVLGSHACLNGISSSSELLSEAMMKWELPSLQYSETQQGSSWGLLASSLPSLESVDTLIQSPPTKQSTHAECTSPRSAGLLEAVVYKSRALKRQKKSSEVKEWEIDGDPNPRLGYSFASEFSECTPICQSSQGCYGKPEEVSQVSTQNVEKKEISYIDFSGPDSSIDWSWFRRISTQNIDQGNPSDAIGALLGEDR